MVVQEALEALARQAVVDAGGIGDRRAIIDAVLARIGPSPLGREQFEEALDPSLRGGALLSLGDDRVIDVAGPGGRLVLTHRLTEDEVATSSLDVTADLGVFDLLADIDGGLHGPDGTPLHRRQRRARSAKAGRVARTVHLTGAAGWLDAFGAGTLVAARATDGFLVLEAVDDDGVAADPPDLREGLDALLAVANEGDSMPVPADELQVLAAVDRESWFTVPRRPFSELVADAGLDVEANLIGPPDCWEAHRRVVAMIGTLTRPDLDEDESAALAQGLKAYDAWSSDHGATPSRLVVERIRRTFAVAHPFVEELRRRDVTPDDLAGFATAVGGCLGHWLASKAAALTGDTETAERLAGQAMASDPGFGPAVAEVAWYASDRGRAREAANLLHRVRGHDDPELVALRRHAAAESPDVGRNEPCPCGSGRKFKTCHLGRSVLPEVARVRWLLDKIAHFVVELAPPDLLDDIEVDPRLGGDMLGIDLLVFDDGWLSRFAAERGPLLPEIERDWIARWATDHLASVFRLAEHLADGREALDDARTGTRYVVGPSAAIAALAPGRLLWTRLLPVDDRWWTTGLVRHVTLAERASLLAAIAPGASVEERLEALAPEPHEPTMQNTSGDPLVLCATVMAVTDPEAATAALDAALTRDDLEPVWRTYATTAGMDAAVTAVVTLGDDGTLTIDTNSFARHESALALVGGILPGAEVVGETRQPMARARAASRTEEVTATILRVLGELDAGRRSGDSSDDSFDDSGDDSFDNSGDDGPIDEGDDRFGGDHDGDGFGFDDGPDRDEDDPLVQAAMAEYLVAHEERWLDAPLPVLGGRSPREAAADDTLRPDLITLLAEMDRPGRSFDTDRARRELGLDPS